MAPRKADMAKLNVAVSSTKLPARATPPDSSDAIMAGQSAVLIAAPREPKPHIRCDRSVLGIWLVQPLNS
jgi:hypothetical protein